MQHASDVLHSGSELNRRCIVAEISLSLLFDARRLYGRNMYDERHSLCAFFRVYMLQLLILMEAPSGENSVFNALQMQFGPSN